MKYSMLYTYEALVWWLMCSNPKVSQTSFRKGEVLGVFSFSLLGIANKPHKYQIIGFYMTEWLVTYSDKRFTRGALVHIYTFVARLLSDTLLLALSAFITQVIAQAEED